MVSQTNSYVTYIDKIKDTKKQNQSRFKLEK